MELEYSAELSDLNNAERAKLDSDYVHFKETPEWANLHTTIVALINNRE